MNAVDTNVLLYSVDHADPVKQSRAIQLLDELGEDESPPVLLWQVAGEFLSCLRRWEDRGRISRTQTELYIRQMRGMFPLVLPTPQVLEKSLDLSDRYSLSHWDSMLLAACVEAGVKTLYTEDMDPGTTYESVSLVNPFAAC